MRDNLIKINLRSRALNVNQLSNTLNTFSKEFPGKVLGKVSADTPSVFLEAMWSAGITHYEVRTLKALRSVYMLLARATILFKPVAQRERDIASAYHNCGVRNFSINRHNDLIKIKRATFDAEDVNLWIDVSELINIIGRDQVRYDRKKFYEFVDLITQAREISENLGILYCIKDSGIFPQAYATAMEVIRSLIVDASVTIDSVCVGGWFPFREPELGNPSLLEYFEVIGDSFEDLPVSYSAELWCVPELEYLHPKVPKSADFEQNSAAPVFDEDEAGRIGLDWRASLEKVRTDDDACRRHSITRVTLSKALNASHIDRTQCYHISDPINEALKALGDDPSYTNPETYVVYSKAIRRQMRDLLSGQSLKPPLSDEQVDRLQEWMDADAAFVSLDDWLAKVENAIYERRFGPVAAERQTLAEMVEAIRSNDAANLDAQNVLDASIDSLPETLETMDPDSKLATETSGNFWREFGRMLHRGWTRGKSIGPKLWNLAQWAAERSQFLKEKMPWLSPIWDFIRDIASKSP